VHCQPWEESSVDITVTVKVDASSQEKADKVFDRISISLNGSASRVDGITSIGNINNSDFSIDYDIRMPKWINIDLNNSFGEIYTGQVDGTAKISLEYGSLEIEALNGMGSEIDMKFSEGEVSFLKDGKVDVEYGEFNADETGNIRVISRFSEVDIEKLANLNLDSQYDEINLGSVAQVISISRFSGLEFDNISGNFEFDIEYGEVSVSNIGAGFGTGKVRNSFANADLGFDPKATFNVDAEMEFGELDYPEGSAAFNKQIEDYTTNIYKGKIGKGSGVPGQLTVRSENGNVSISFTE